MKILAVDDDDYILEILTVLAGRSGFTDFTTALSGEIALKILNQGDVVYDCLLLDINMPGIDGIELCKLVRTLPAYRKTPILMLTAMSEKDYIDRAFQAGASDFINKPFEIADLTARLRMAEELFIARQEAAAALSEIGAYGSDDANKHGPLLFDRIQMDEIENLVEYDALGNYLLQLSRSSLGGSQVLAVKVDRIEAIHARASVEEFLYTLTEVADAIGQVLRPNGYMMTYAGNGAFVAITNRATLEPSGDLETEIQSILDEKNTEYDSGDPLDIDVSIGNPIRPNASQTQGIRKTFQRAIARAENRSLKKGSKPRQINIRRVVR